MKPTTIALIVAALVVLCGLGWFLTQSSAPKDTLPPPPGVSATVPAGAPVVVLTKDGFSPSTLTVKKGDTVYFTTNAGQMFWPASNPHPSHTLLPGFDPLAPIQADEEWSYKFDVVGDHPYHDHLAPYFTGLITVTP